MTAAILDTGIHIHPDFDRRILDFKDFVNKRNHTGCYDDSGHGTHVCGCLASSGAASKGRYRGIAPECNIVVGKVLDKNGDGSVEDMIHGIEWILSVKKKYSIQILNISVGVGKISNEQFRDDLIEALQTVWDAGIVVVAAAGNSGPAPMSISPIAASKSVITVGCHDGNYKNEHLCEQYSGRGPSVGNLKKPDLVAPGTNIISCCKDIIFNGREYQHAYIQKSGTSMATPLVAGAVALILQKEHNLTNEEVRRKLIYSASDMGEPWSKQGWGMLNIRKMFEI